MSYPNKIKARRKIDALTGIKSSLEKIRSVIALTYLMYVANKRNSFVKYSVSDGNRIKIEPNLLKNIEGLINKEDLSDLVNNNPLIVNQYEPLYVGVSLLMKLGYLKMEGKPNTAERVGRNRYPKQLYFATNIITLDLILSGFSEDERFSALYEWLQNKKSINHDFENKICTFLTTCTIFTQFKLRDDENNEIFFQTEGIYSALRESKDAVEYIDSHEFVGPTRIYNNILREELEPWIKINKGLLSYTDNKIPIGFLSMGDIISNTLDIYNVNNDSTDLDNIDETNEDIFKSSNDDQPCQQIFYGAPGTGKSHEVKRITKGESVIRTTFHPDSDYSTFVGAYKPTMKPVADKYKAVAGKDEEITYEFVEQAFLQAYVKAWTFYAEAALTIDLSNPKKQYLVIEEINRGNCAQIFGDLFQLLDRKEGFSEYPIQADTDMQKHLHNALKDLHDIDVPALGGMTKEDTAEAIKNGKVLVLPPNLYIWATMNTSDQSLFPIDSAFKRRWDWKYMPIKNHEKEGYTIKINETIYDWWGFIDKINSVIDSMTHSEDKKLGYFFVKAENKVVNAEQFVGKVLFYLWNDVFKNYGFDSPIFNKDEKEKLNFSDFFEIDGSPNTDMVMLFLKNIDEKIKPEKSIIITIGESDNPASLIIKYNGEEIDGASSRAKYINVIEKILAVNDANQVANCIGADMTQTPAEESTRRYQLVGDSGWYLATNNSVETMRSKIQKLKETFNLDLTIE